MVSLAALSDTILVHIRDIIGSNLAAHVALSQTCRRLRELYLGGDSEAFWRFVCFRTGFGRPRRRTFPGDSATPPSWRAIALILVRHAQHCEIKSCKAANACFAKYYKNNPFTSVLEADSVHPQYRIHRLYWYLHFTHSPGSSEPGSPLLEEPLTLPDVDQILTTALPTFPESRRSQYGPLCVHPNASCAFASFPPSSYLNFHDPFGRVFLTVENPDGVTILDVNRALNELVPVDEDRFRTALEHYRGLLMTSGQSLAEFTENIRRDRGFLGDHEYPFLDQVSAHA